MISKHLQLRFNFREFRESFFDLKFLFKFFTSFSHEFSNIEVYISEESIKKIKDCCENKNDKERYSLLGCKQSSSKWNLNWDRVSIRWKSNFCREYILIGIDPPGKCKMNENCYRDYFHCSFMNFCVESRGFSVNS